MILKFVINIPSSSFKSMSKLVEGSPFDYEGWIREVECPDCACILEFQKKDVYYLPMYDSTIIPYYIVEDDMETHDIFVECPNQQCGRFFRLGERYLYKKIKDSNQGRIPGRVITNNRWQNWYYDIIKRKVFEYIFDDVENDGGNFRIKNEDDRYVYIGNHISAFDKARCKHSSNCVVM